MSQVSTLSDAISTNPEIAEAQESQIARTLICNYENFLIALVVFKDAPNASVEDKTKYAKTWQNRMSTLRTAAVGVFPAPYDPIFLECLQAVGSTTIVSP